MPETINSRDESFRDTMSTISEKGKRNWIYAKKPKGKFWIWRNVVGLFLLSFFFSAPLIKIHDDPLLLFDFIHRKFILLGVTFWPQDSFIFFLLFISFMVFIILFTVIYGRIWCGWACPQTIFLELIFRRIEFWIEGDYAKQKKMAKQVWNLEKIVKKGFKHLIFIAISLLIINTFMSYILAYDGLIEFWRSGASEHPIGFAAMYIFSFAFYFIYSSFREQVCIIMCPYGRLQGVLLDKKSIVISYDYKRGEPKTPFRREENRLEANKGACINCNSCVMVCPTGIDIRNGTQLECINCTACMDACDEQMIRTNQPKGLIKYASEEQIAQAKKFNFSFRMVAYSAVLLGLLTFLAIMLNTRSDIESSILRTPGMLYQIQENNLISNLYNIKIINKTKEEIPVELKLLSHQGIIKIASGDLKVKGENSTESVFFLYLDADLIKDSKSKVTFGVYSNGDLIQEVDSWFVGP
ncbi:MAG: cytochrome c oxidase accessory protein CcoG [Bacteroidetes bacterium]|jgi:cytochrome c oxidase accessory protein FixG|nr:cytochrome c oxidase accessory protein CcoG [Bacteroidota bacterium]MBT3935144.1 cytochrome c oxidase accessory protein CcoG [Bacteroidota bacterium]MBT7826918.1 cytochrome c oxidase accessory protein CcoG [Bacteroidota bacterium]